MIAEEIRAIVEYLAKQKPKGVLIVLILIPALLIGFKWIAPNRNSTSPEKQPEQAELQEEEVAEEPSGETPIQPASRGAVAGDSQPEKEEPAIFVKITPITSPVTRGEDVTLKAKTLPNAACSITVYYKSRPSEEVLDEEGLEDKNADSNGNVSWTWKIERGTPAGSWRIVVACSFEGKTTSDETSFVEYSTPELP